MSSKTLTAAGPPPAADELAPELAEPYRRLLRVLRGSREMFALVPVESLLSRLDNDRLLDRLRGDLERERLELRLADVFYENWDPLEAIERAWQNLDGNTAVVVVLRGLERTPPAPLGLTKARRPLAFARLNQVREHIEKHFQAPLVVWCEPESFGALQRYAPDFFDHFTGLVRFGTAVVSQADEVREPTPQYQVGGRAEGPRQATGGSRSALRFYEAQIEKSPDGSPERVRALLGLAEALVNLSGSEKPAAANRALEAAQQALASISKDEDPQEWARAQYIQGGALEAAGMLEDARASFERALEIRRALAQDKPEAFEKDVAPTLIYLGNVLSDLGERDAARTAYEEALEIYRRLAEHHPAAFEPDVAMTLNNLGNVLSDLGERDAARTAFEEALEIYRRLAEHHPAAFEPDVAMTLNNLGTVLRDLGERDAARTAYEEALEIDRRLAEHHPAAFEPSVAMTLNNLGNVLRDLGERDAARTSFERALQIFAPFQEKWPAAFDFYLIETLRNYVAVAPEDDQDPWRQRWNELQESSDADPSNADPSNAEARQTA